MSYSPNWTEEADMQFKALQSKAIAARANRISGSIKKKSNVEGLFAQVQKAIGYLLENPKHPSLHTHPFDSKRHPFDANERVFEAYAQNKTPGAYRIYWCYGPGKRQITFIAIMPHP